MHEPLLDSAVGEVSDPFIDTLNTLDAHAAPTGARLLLLLLLAVVLATRALHLYHHYHHLHHNDNRDGSNQTGHHHDTF